MSHRKEKRRRRASRASSPPEAYYERFLFDTLQEQLQTFASSLSSPSPSSPSSSLPSLPSLPVSSGAASSAGQGKNVHPLEIMLEPAVILRIMEFFERGGPTAQDIEEARAFGHTLATQGDNLLYRSRRPGETANLFNGLARSVAVLAHLPGGVFLFGTSIDAERVLAGFVGEEAARMYITNTPFRRKGS